MALIAKVGEDLTAVIGGSDGSLIAKVEALGGVAEVQPRSGIFVSPLRDKNLYCILTVHNNSNFVRKAAVSLHLDGVEAHFEYAKWTLAPYSPTEQELKGYFSPASDYYIKVRILNSGDGDLVDEIPLSESFSQFNIYNESPFMGAMEITPRPYPIHEMDRSKTCTAALRMARASVGGFTFDDEMLIFNATHDSLVGEGGYARTINVLWEMRGFGGELIDEGSFNVEPLYTVKLKTSDLGVPDNSGGVVFLTFTGNPEELLLHFTTSMLLNGAGTLSVVRMPWVTDE